MLYIEKQATNEDRTEDTPFFEMDVTVRKRTGKWILSLRGHTLKRM